MIKKSSEVGLNNSDECQRAKRGSPFEYIANKEGAQSPPVVMKGNSLLDLERPSAKVGVRR
jgi:hypothetical protein